MSPSPLAISPWPVCEPSGSLTPLGPRVFIATLEVDLAATASVTKLWNVWAGSNCAHLVWGADISPQVFPLLCKCFHFIVWVRKKERRESRRQGRSSIHILLNSETGSIIWKCITFSINYIGSYHVFNKSLHFVTFTILALFGLSFICFLVIWIVYTCLFCPS